MSSRLPPSFVPTLTEVLRDDGSVEPLTPVSVPATELPAHETPVTALPAQAGVANALWLSFEDQVVQRVLQRVDLTLERRLHEALVQLLESQTRSLMPRLRDEIEAVVRSAINDAVAQEMDAP